MSKRESLSTLNRPVVRAERVSAKSDVLPICTLVPPVEPLHSIVSIPFSSVTPEIIDAAPIAHYLRTQFDGKYSRQCLLVRLIEMIDQESWHARYGVRQFRAIHSANCVLIEALLDALDEREVERAA